jgi:hypothetical protein
VKRRPAYVVESTLNDPPEAGPPDEG